MPGNGEADGVGVGVGCKHSAWSYSEPPTAIHTLVPSEYHPLGAVLVKGTL